MHVHPADGWRLSVLNAGGRDAEQDFPDGAGDPDDPAAPHPPVNYHAYAACTHGTFHARTASAIAAGRPVLLLLRRDLASSLRVLTRLKSARCVVAVTFKEAGANQIAARLNNAADLRVLKSILETADGFIAPTIYLQAFLASIHGNGAFIPTPYPIADSRWNFSRAERRGIFIGTREFGVPARQHLAAILTAARLHRLSGEPVTVINTEGRKGARLLAEAGFSNEPMAALRIVEGPLSYATYLREMAAQRVVFQLDRSGVPGQVAGDALLCRLPCIGGDGAIEQLAFGDLSGATRTPGELARLLHEFMLDPERCEEAVRVSQREALKSVSFEAVAEKLRKYFDSL